jgi:hypothetical protein
MSFGKMCTKFRCVQSYNGYKLDVVKSAMQKYIRRCDVEKAMYAAAELDLFALDPKGEGVRTNFIHRLMIIFMEDVFEPSLWTDIDYLIFKLLDIRNDRKGLSIESEKYCQVRREEINMISKIVSGLATSQHGRNNSYYKFCMYTFTRMEDSEKEKILKIFPWMKDVEESTKLVYKPRKTPEVFSKLSGELLRVASNFVGSLQARHESCIYFAHVLSTFKKMPFRTSNSQNPAFMILYLIEFVLKEEKHPYLPFVTIGIRWFKELTPLKEEFLCWQHILLFMLKNEENRPIPSYKHSENVDRLYLLYKKNIDMVEMEFDDWVFDMHTSIGTQKKRGHEHFAKISSFVCNESQTVNIPYKNVYTYFKVLEDIREKEEENEKKNKTDKKENKKKIEKKDNDEKEQKEDKKEKEEKKKTDKKEVFPIFLGKEKNKSKDKKEKSAFILEKDGQSDKETEFARFIIRAQLITSNSKTDTYFAEKNGSVIFMKGPFKNVGEIEEFMSVQQIKNEVGLPTIQYTVVFLKPDLFDETPLGMRNTLDRSKTYPFLVSSVLFEYKPNEMSDIPIEIRTSQLWKNIPVVNWKKPIRGMAHLDFKEVVKDPDMMRDFVYNIIFRYIMGIGDFADRNFLMSKGRVYSVDEDSIGRDFNWRAHLKKAYHDSFLSYMKKHSKDVKEFIKKFERYVLPEGGSVRLREMYDLC